MAKTKTKTTPPPETQVNYYVARDMIKTGDIINFFMSHEDSALHRVTTEATLYFTGSRIFHTGTAVWVTSDAGGRRLMLCEAVGKGRRLVNMSNFAEHKMEVHPMPYELDHKAVELYLLDGIGWPYGFWNLIGIAAREFFGMKPKMAKDSLVCSETAARAWQAGGLEFETTALSPGKLRNVLCEKGILPAFTVNPDAGK